MKFKSIHKWRGMVLAGMLMCTVLPGRAATLDQSFDSAQEQLLNALNLTLADFDARWTQARVEGDLEKVMDMRLYRATLEQYESGQLLVVLCRSEYDIGAVGGESIRFKLKKLNDNQTAVSVDYSDRWWGCWPPFIFWNPGPVRQSKIRSIIFPPRKAAADKQ